MHSTNKTADVVIIGGGIMGCSLAYYLAKQSKKNILLLEKNLLAQGSTGLSVGGIRQQFSHPANILLSQMTLHVMKTFKDEFETDVCFHPSGYLFLAQTEETWREFLSNIETQKKHGVPVEQMTPGEINTNWPYLETRDLEGGTFCHQDGYTDPYLITMAFAKNARRLGVQISEKTTVQRILVEAQRARGVVCENLNVSSPVVVNTSGPWAAQVGKMAGLDLPVKPYRRQVFMTKKFQQVPKPVPMIIDMDDSFYFRGDPPGILMGMSDLEEKSSFNTHVDRDFLEKIVAIATHRIPIFQEAEILRGWAGLYATTPDQNPIIGQAPEIEGFYNAVGFSGHGFQHGPAVGQILAELIEKGQTDFDLSPFTSSRFSSFQKQGEKRAV